MEKLSCESLMIGDWVKFRCFDDSIIIGQIVEIHDEIVYLKSTLGRHWANLKDIEPIPLTPEILEKNGFVGEGYQILTLDDGHWLEYYHHEHRLTRYWEGIDEWQNHSKVRDIVFRCHCYYVHELQHALKLCGIEKEIEL